MPEVNCKWLASNEISNTDHYSLSLATQPVFNPAHCLPIQTKLHEDLRRKSLESHIEIYSLLTYQASNSVTEGYQAGQARHSLGESMMKTPTDFHVIHVSGNGFQD